MPLKVVELAQGNAFSQSSEGGRFADRATRVYKVILNSPAESWDISTAVGVEIGDNYNKDAGTGPPCVSIDMKAEGESRVSRIVTVTYQTTAGSGTTGALSGGGGGGGSTAQDPRTQSPSVRPPNYSLSSSLQQVPAVGGAKYMQNGWVTGTLTNSVGDRIEGLTRLEPVVNLQIDQYSTTDQSHLLQYTGYVNADTITFSGATIKPHTIMLQSINAKPHVEVFGGSTFRGFLVSFVFTYRTHYSNDVTYGDKQLGWDQPVVNSGFNVLNGPSTVDSTVEIEHLALKHKNKKVAFPYALGTPVGTKVRASIIIPASSEGSTATGTTGMAQRPSAQQVLLNENGSPRKRTLPPIVYRIQTQPDVNFSAGGSPFGNFGIRNVG
jgi:hypothetical protein